MDVDRVAQTLRSRVPQLAADVDIDALAATALAAWTTQHVPTGQAVPPAVARPEEYAALRSVVDATWPIGYAAGVHAGHTITAGYVAAAALDRAERARPGISDAHRDLANRLQAARVSTDALQGYLAKAGWRNAVTWRGGFVFQTVSLEADVVATLVPRAGARDHVARILDAATTLADVEDRDVASVLADLASPPARPALGHAALRYLWDVYDTATELAHLPPRVNDPGPSNNDYLTAYGDLGDETDLGRLVAAARVGYQHGFHEGHGDGAWSAGSRLLSQVQHRVALDLPTSVRIDGRTPVDWLRTVDTDARWAADAVRHSRHPSQLSAASAAARAFAPMTTLQPAHTPLPAAPSRPSTQPRARRPR